MADIYSKIPLSRPLNIKTGPLSFQVSL